MFSSNLLTLASYIGPLDRIMPSCFVFWTQALLVGIPLPLSKPGTFRKSVALVQNLAMPTPGLQPEARRRLRASWFIPKSPLVLWVPNLRLLRALSDKSSSLWNRPGTL